MSVIEATSNAFHRHPALILGSLAGIVAIGYVLTRGGGSGGGGGTTVMQYSVGPSDAAVNAGAAIQMAQIAANATTAQMTTQVNGQVALGGINAGVATRALDAGVSTAQLQATTQQQQANFSYLTALSNNSTVSHVSDNSRELGAIQANDSASVLIQQSNNNATVALTKANYDHDTANWKIGTDYQLASQVDQNKTNLANIQMGYDHDTQTQVIARNAAMTGSILAIQAHLSDTYNSEIWSSIVSGQSDGTLTQLRQAQQSAMDAVNGSSHNWQQFA